VADSIRKAGEQRSAFVADSIRKLGDAQTKNILDSIKAKEAREAEIKAKEAEKRKAASASNAGSKTELHWVGNGDESGRVVFEKLAGAGLKTGKCGGNGIKVSLSSSPSCKHNATGTVKCSYTPQLTLAACDGAQIEKLAFSRELNGSSKDESAAKQKLLEELEKASFSEWAGRLKSLRR